MVINIDSLVKDSNFHNNSPIILTRCPGRISLSKHADYINSDLLYVLDDRAVYLAAQKTIRDGDGQIKLINQNTTFEAISFLNSQCYSINKNSWGFYIAKILSELKLTNGFDLTIVINSNLPDASGLSSSHALMVAAILALKDLFDIKLSTLEIMQLCKTVDNAKGFNSGLGDQAAQLLSTENHFNFIKLFPTLQQSSITIPEDLGLMTVPSFIKAQKSNPEFKAANDNIALYQKINELAQTNLVKQLGGNVEINYLADLLLHFNDKEILIALESITDLKTRGIALYGLAEAARLKQLKENFSIEKLSEHLQLSHQAEKNYHLIDGQWQRIAEAEQLNYFFDIDAPLAKHSGIYLASTLANDILQTLALTINGVLGSSISGAGLGGNNIILCKRNQAAAIKQELINHYYKTMGLESEANSGIHLIKPSKAAQRLL